MNIFWFFAFFIFNHVVKGSGNTDSKENREGQNSRSEGNPQLNVINFNLHDQRVSINTLIM